MDCQGPAEVRRQEAHDFESSFPRHADFIAWVDEIAV